MKFEAGKEYGTIRIEKGSAHYVTISGAFCGRKLIRKWFNGGEFIVLPFGAFCCSWETKKYQILTNEDLTGIDCDFCTYDDYRVNVKSFGKMAIVTITGDNPDGEMEAQLSDGIFENIKVTEAREG